MKKHAIFISHSTKDRQYVDKLTDMLKKMDITYWLAPDMIEAGMSYAQMIPGAIEGCEVFLLLLSEQSQNSIWVEKEIDSAIYYRKTIIPFQIDNLSLKETFRFYLNNVQVINAVGRQKAAISELKSRLRELVKESDTPSLVVGKQEKESEKSLQVVEKQIKEPKKSSHAVGEKKDTSKTDSTEKMRKTKRGLIQDGGEKNLPVHQTDDAPQISQNMQGELERRRRLNILDERGAPLACQYCGGYLEEIKDGVFKCLECGKEDYDYYRKVKKFLCDNGAHSALEIEKETGVPRKSIMQMLNRGLFDIPKKNYFRKK